MFRFSSLVLASILGGASASNPSIAGYEPVTLVTDHAGIAGDQAVIEKLCGLGTTAGLDQSLAVYEQGGHSKSFAEITITGGLQTTVLKGTNMEQGSISGKALEDTPSGSPTIKMQYSTSDSVLEYVNCKVGGLPDDETVTAGCLEPNGVISITGAGGDLDYTTVENGNARTIKGFSTGANRRMRPGDDLNEDFFSFYVPYLNYYGSGNFDFGDTIALAGFTGLSTNLANGNVDLAGYGEVARCQVAKKATAYIITSLYAQREMFDAIYDCNEECATVECNDDAVHALDEAVAFYVGNLHSEDGRGNLAYALAEKRCKNFATCVDGTSGMSNVNKEIMQLFNTLKGQFSQAQCDETQANVDEVVELMQIPMVQGTLRYAYFTDINETPTEAMQAEGYIFAAGILPKVHACSETDAKTIYDNMVLKRNQNTKADFAAVKKAFENNYKCMGITCADVGGLVDETTGNTYYKGAEPCGGVVGVGMSAGVTHTLSVVGGIVAVVAAFMM